MGYRSLSMNTSNVARIKYILRKSDSTELQQLLDTAMQQAYGTDIYNLVFQYLEQKIWLALFAPVRNKCLSTASVKRLLYYTA